MALYAGQSIGLIYEIKSVAGILNEIINDALNVLSNLNKLIDSEISYPPDACLESHPFKQSNIYIPI